MTVKEMAKNLIDTLPEDTTIDDIIYALYVRAKIEQGLNEIEDGKGIPHEEVKKKLYDKWVR